MVNGARDGRRSLGRPLSGMSAPYGPGRSQCLGAGTPSPTGYVTADAMAASRPLNFLPQREGNLPQRQLRAVRVRRSARAAAPADAQPEHHRQLPRPQQGAAARLVPARPPGKFGRQRGLIPTARTAARPLPQQPPRRPRSR